MAVETKFTCECPGCTESDTKIDMANPLPPNDWILVRTVEAQCMKMYCSVECAIIDLQNEKKEDA